MVSLSSAGRHGYTSDPALSELWVSVAVVAAPIQKQCVVILDVEVKFCYVAGGSAMLGRFAMLAHSHH